MKEEYSIVLGTATIFLLFFIIEMVFFLHEIFLGAMVFTILAFTIGGFIATLTADNGRMRIGLFSGVVFSIVYVILFNLMFSPLDDIQFILTYGVALVGCALAGLGGFIAKFLHERYNITPELLEEFL